MNESKISAESEEVEVDIVEEHWNVYKLEDGSRVRTRVIVNKALVPKSMKYVKTVGSGFLINAQTIVVAFPPSELRGPKNPKAVTQEDMESADSEEIPILSFEEKWNFYKIPGKEGRIKVKMVVSSIYRIKNFYNQDGEPVYTVNSTIALGPTS